MNWIITKNNKRINTYDIPTITIEKAREDIKEMGFRPISFFGNQEDENIRLYIALADDKNGEIYISSILFSPETKEYNSFTTDFTQFHIFEREFYEEFKIKPLKHPWLKPVRKNLDEYPFFKMEGEDVHEVAVGPIHAGVIEPGHFRFMCQGEKVYDLEIMLGYQNKNIENLLTQKINNQLAESICGDSVIAYNMAYSQIIETLSETEIPQRAEIIRRIALEMERIAIHIGDMGAISGDIAYLMGASIYGTTRTLVINTLLEISGSRFGRGLINSGGVLFDIDENLSIKITKTLNEVEQIVDRITKTILKKPSCLSRMEKTGVVSQETAKALGAVGMAARTSGINIDSRFDFNDKWYSLFKKPEFSANGDVHSRFLLRYKEIKDSISFIKQLLNELKNHKTPINTNIKFLLPNSFAISIVEGWRGEIVHIAITGANSEIIRYKIKDPSFNNWYMLAMAVRNNGISDFPLCNKSFNLSYCGNDL